jgi:hypothetical protein
MTRGKWLLITGPVLAVLAIGLAIFIAWPTGPRGGLAQSDAIRIARVHAGPQATSVISAEIRENFNTGFAPCPSVVVGSDFQRQLATDMYWCL